MVEALQMPEDLISRTIETVKGNAELWKQIKDREIDIEENGSSDLNPLVFWSIAEIVDKDRRYSIGALVVRLRYHAREELGLPV